MRTVYSFALGAVTGAVAARLLSGGTGQKVAHQAATSAADSVKSAVHAATPSRKEPMDDATIADRVRSEIFRDAHAPKGDVSIDVQAGVVYLRGEVSDASWMDRLPADARRVEGVTGVKNLLHAPGTPTPSAEPRGLASGEFGG
jgi:osmotically-inducible protein OsmY